MRKLGGRPVASRKGKLKFIGKGRAIRTGRTTRRRTLRERGKHEKLQRPQRQLRER
jgi:hypothetical protein